MSGLILKLSPRERILINGAVIENGDRRSRLAIMTPDANILRLRDAIHPEDAKTPVRRVCYAVQLVLSGDTEAADARRNLFRSVEELSQVFIDHDSRKHLDQASHALVAGDYYRCLKSLRTLLPREERLLAAGA
jgi:flagellar protein FlbT